MSQAGKPAQREEEEGHLIEAVKQKNEFVSSHFPARWYAV
jgi:hypothetical protein